MVFSAQITNIARSLRLRLPRIPGIALVLGSGFQSVGEAITVEDSIGYAQLPGFPRVTTAGHEGRLVMGRLAGVPVILCCGRAHFYEGNSMEQITFPTRVLAEMGVRHLLLTNAAGGIAPRLRPGEFMYLTDHINFMGINPLRELDGLPGSPFLDLSQAYDEQLNDLLKLAARNCRLTLYGGVYLAVSGPSYETPAEIRAFKQWGADAVGMSTVPETMVARRLGMKVAGLSCITNRAAGLTVKSLSHEEVLSVGDQVKANAAALLAEFVRCYGECGFD